MINAVITKKGRVLQNKQINGAKLTFTRVVAGTASTLVENLQDQLVVTNVAQTLSIQSVKLNDGEQSYTILVLLENTNLKSSYNLNQIGFYANDPNDGEILFAVAQFDTPKKIETPTISPGYTLEMPFTFKNENSADVTINLDPDNLMSRAGVEAMLQSEEINGKASGNVIAVSDGTDSPFLDFKLFGKSKQPTTTGKNKLKVEKSNNTYKGVSFEYEKDGTVIATGTPTEIFSAPLYGEYGVPIPFPAGDYIVSGGVDKNHYVRVRVHSSDGELKSQHYDINESRRFTVEDEDLISVTLYFAVTTTVKTIRFYPMIRDASIEDDTFEMYTDEKPSPSTSYQQEIDSTGEDGSIDLNVQGKNLWTVDNTNETLTYDPTTQIMTISGSVAQTLHKLPIPIPKGTMVTISAKVIGGVVTSSGDGGLAFGGYYKPEKGTAIWQGYINIPKCSVADLTGQEYRETFEVEKEVTHFYAFVYAATASIHEPLKLKVQYEINNYATEMELHKVGQMANIPLPLGGLRGVPVASDGNYTDADGQEWVCDEINLAKRKFYQRIGSAIIDGSKPFNKNSGQPNDNNFVYFTNKANYGIDTSRYEGYCTHMLCKSSPSLGGMCLYFASIPHVLYIDMSGFLNSDSSLNSAENAMSALAENNVEVQFILSEPIETDLTDEQIAAFEALLTYERATTILMDGIGNMEVSYFKNTENGKAMGILKSEHIYLKKLIGDVNAVVQNLVG